MWWQHGKENQNHKKAAHKGDYGCKVVSVRMREEMIEQLGTLSARTNRPRNERINLLPDAAIKIVKAEEYPPARARAIKSSNVIPSFC